MNWIIFALVAIVVIYLLYAWSTKMWPFNYGDDEGDYTEMAASLTEGQATDITASKITKAEWGVPNTSKTLDVTAVLQGELVKKRKMQGLRDEEAISLRIVATNVALGGDPAVGETKTLTVKYLD